MKTIRTFGAILCLAAPGTRAMAATTDEAAKQAVVTLSPHHTSVNVALEYISQQSGIKVDYNKPDKDDPTVSLELNNVSVANAFQEIAAMANLTVKDDDDLVFFTAKK